MSLQSSTTKTAANILFFFVWVAFVLWAISVVLRAYAASTPDVRLPPENRSKFAEVFVCLDGTPSIREENFEAAKRVVAEQIVPALGIGDVFVAYSIRSDVGLPSIISGSTHEEQFPQPPPAERARMLDVLARNGAGSQGGPVDDETYELLRELRPALHKAQSVRDGHTARVLEMPRPPKGSNDTNITCLLNEIGGRLRARSDSRSDKFLFILSDLREDPGGLRSCSLDKNSMDAFNDVHIVLIYPYNSNQAQWDKVRAYWKKFFGNREAEQEWPLSEARVQSRLLPPNPTAGLEKYQFEGFGHYLSRMLSEEGIVALSVLISAGAFRRLLKRKTGNAPTQQAVPAAEPPRRQETPTS